MTSKTDEVSKTPELTFYETKDGKAAWREMAERYAAHEFNILGSGWTRVHFGMQARGFESIDHSDTKVTSEAVQVGMSEFQKTERSRLLGLAGKLIAGYEPIDWFIDFKSGYRYPLKHFSEIRYGLVDGVDAKVPYDLSRCCHLTVLARAWQETGEARFRREVMAQMLDWLSANPVEYGIGWHANMNVAIRLTNWIVAAEIIRKGRDESDVDEQAFWHEFETSLLAHRKFVSGNLEFAETSIHPNHYLADLGGLLVGSSYLSTRDIEQRNWRRMAIREIQLEIDRQIGADGFDYEAATNYHAFALEMLVMPLIIAAKLEGCERPHEITDWLKTNVGEARTEKLHRMFGALRELIQPNHRLPLIGDIDNGRFLYLETPGHHECDWRFLCCLGAALFADDELWPDDYGAAELSLARVMLREPVLREESQPKEPTSSAFREAGFYLMKTASVYSAVFAGPIGTNGGGGHAHDDKLSFTFSLGALDFIVDPGIYVYTANRHYRDLYRSVEVHNTVCVDGQQQNRRLDESPWWGCHEDTRCEVLKWNAKPGEVVFEARHSGYCRLATPLIHRRRIELSESQRVYTVQDFIEAEDPNVIRPSVSLNLTLHPDCEIVRNTGDCVLLQQAGVELEIETEQGSWEVADGVVSPSYGVKRATQRLVLRFESGIPANILRLRW